MKDLVSAIAAAAAIGAAIGAAEGIGAASGNGSRVDGLAIVLVGAAFGAFVGAAAGVPLGVASRAAGWASKLRERLPVVVGAAALGLTAALLTAVLAAPTADRGGEPGKPSLVLITVDTLRRDHVGAYGGPPTPSIDALARDGVVYLDAVSPLPETAPAHASLLTARQPLRHGVLSNGDTLDAAVPTIASTLAGQGWATGAFVSSVALSSRTGLDRGFDRYDDALVPFGLGRSTPVRLGMRAWMRIGSPARTPWLLERAGRRTTDRALDWAADHAKGAFFLWVHYFEPHAPYDSDEIDHRARIDDPSWTDAEKQALRRAYAAEVQRADAEVGRLVAGVEALGVTPTIVLTSDHGELLGEHGVDFAHRDLWEEVVRVPLIVRRPGLAHTEVAAQVRLADAGATLLESAGVHALDGAEGIPLLRYATGERKKSLWTTLVGHRGRSLRDGPEIGLREDGSVLIAPLDGPPEWYDLASDAGEARNLAADPERAAEVERARVKIGADEAALRQALGRPATPDAMLDALGYRQ